jgi:hypothetical protein
MTRIQCSLKKNEIDDEMRTLEPGANRNENEVSLEEKALRIELK